MVNLDESKDNKMLCCSMEERERERGRKIFFFFFFFFFFFLLDNEKKGCPLVRSMEVTRTLSKSSVNDLFETGRTMGD